MKSDKKNILLIGGAGYIGQVLINYFLKKKYKIGVVDNLIYKHKLEKRNKVKFHNLSVDKINNITNDYEKKSMALIGRQPRFEYEAYDIAGRIALKSHKLDFDKKENYSNLYT